MTVDSNRWWIGWHPGATVVGLLVLGGIVGATIDAVGGFLFIGLIAGFVVWYLAVSEVNSNYEALLEDFETQSRSAVESETGGLDVSSMYTFIAPSGDSPPLVKSSEMYAATHLLFGETSVVINEEFDFDMKNRNQRRGGTQEEIFYDQIANVSSENFSNYAQLEMNLSGGGTHTIRSGDPSGINQVKSDLQQKMRRARKA